MRKLLSVAVTLAALAAAPPALADSGGFQAGIQNAITQQLALGLASSTQNAVNANVPVTIAGGNVSAGPSNATQTASSTATADVKNRAKTDQDQHLTQNVGGSSCAAGCGGSGGFQAGVQKADTAQAAVGVAKSDQNAVNANVPVTIAGGNVSSGSSTADQKADSTASTEVKNKAKTDQDQHLTQNVGGGSCKLGCGGAGGFQAGIQKADTRQIAVGLSKSDQNAVNANVPVTIAGKDVRSGSSSANQDASSKADADVSNRAKTDQDQDLQQNVGGGGSCYAGCGGAGGFQLGLQDASTWQLAAGIAKSDQNAVNGNAPATVAGGDVWSGGSDATQTATSGATADVHNKAKTDQHQSLGQQVGSDSGRGCGCDRKPSEGTDHADGCFGGCGGPGGFQLGIQHAETKQIALGLALSHQNAVNGNSPHTTAGGNVYADGPSGATQTATSHGDATVANRARTKPSAWLDQDLG
jgi:hypothetical protein